MKNLRPLETKLIKMNMSKLKLITPLAIVNTLYGNGVKPAKKEYLAKQENLHLEINCFLNL